MDKHILIKWWICTMSSQNESHVKQMNLRQCVLIFLLSSTWELNTIIQIWRKSDSSSLFVNQMWLNGIEPLLESLAGESQRWFLTKLQSSFTGVSQCYRKIQKVLLLHRRKIQMLSENNVRYVHTREKSTNMNVSCVSNEGRDGSNTLSCNIIQFEHCKPFFKSWQICLVCCVINIPGFNILLF